MVDTDTFNAAVLKEQWTDIAVRKNEQLKAYGEERGIMIGTTLSAMLMYEDKYYIIHVGDSRVYELTSELNQLTQDQTFVAREIAAGRMTPEQAETDSRRSILLQCIGASPVVEPDFIRGYIEETATYLLCSDGFRHKITPEEMLEKLGPAAAVDEATMKQGCEYLTELVKYRKETDNITVLLISTK
jgi:serine/threonine protein phosphatase PrpC